VPVLVRKEAYGFVLNRLQAVLMAEAFRLVGEGVVSPEDLDKTIRDGLGLRWAFMGPFETIELNAPGGIPDYCARYGDFFRRTTGDPPAPAVWDEANLARVMKAWGKSPSKDEVARRTAWRDKRLTALMAHKRAQPGN
jgi:3-hydroxyacyl-CoA dehydrogenase